MQTEGRSKNRWKETSIAIGTGMLFGGWNTIIGHPFDTVKTKMQAETSHMGKKGYIDSVKMVYGQQGLGGFYRGWCPPFIGSVIFRSLQFTIYEIAHTSLKDNQFAQ